ncbi:hypothetical protein OG308_23820 [Nocardia salmonicida]|uniref:Uncharacterized protein n=1 Tax=Nocardia salmonicida TaxID=53431 RepID=A0ABZ1N2Y7_9NOCA
MGGIGFGVEVRRCWPSPDGHDSRQVAGAREMKWDGVRAIAHRTPTGISLWSRNLRERNNAEIMPMGCFVDEGDLVIDAIVNVNGFLDVGLLG